MTDTAEAKPKTPAQSLPQIRQTDKGPVVRADWNAAFNDLAVPLGGRWTGVAKEWTFPAGTLAETIQPHLEAFKNSPEKEAGRDLPAMNREQERTGADGMPAKPVYQITEKGDQIYVHAPYDRGFIQMANATGGRWNPDDKTWAFPKEMREEVTKMCDHAFHGKGDRQGVKAMVRRISQALASHLPPLPVVGKGALLVGRLAVQTIAFGYDGLDGVRKSQMFLGHPPRFRKIATRSLDGLSATAPSNLMGNELAMERGLQIGR